MDLLVRKPRITYKLLTLLCTIFKNGAESEVWPL